MSQIGYLTHRQLSARLAYRSILKRNSRERTIIRVSSRARQCRLQLQEDLEASG